MRAISILFLFIFVAFYTNCSGQHTAQKKFSGSWSYKHFSENNPLFNTVFTLHLKQNENNLVGCYCAVARNGKRIDCSNDESIKNIRGKIRNDTAYVHFTGFYDRDATGKAKLYFKDGQLIWKIYESSGEIYAPSKAKLNELHPKSDDDLDK